ncbi:MAG: bifunctional diaminohydroxyphosphoribosylaminopyrimidine deaminase/5-amino-6-(5-phosphoribosylamino)uracil reductase RibD [Pseudomonadales bacterium]|nr:bifunctional diaminohydroxyphosphoribosylaminopyrimidine deaminase/5-amino-6-(5-phosphoribosylamino)uracil reductase RibD [Pseudomonadales bacterium]
MSARERDISWLERAVTLALNGVNTTSPNPHVGCVFVRDGRVIGEGWHQWAGQGHAEVNAMAAAGGDVRGSTAYVSLEPCSWEGRTPACARSLIAAGVARVVIAELDPHPKVRGSGVAMLRDAGIVVDIVELASAQALNPGAKKRHATGLPHVRIKIAASLDGRTAMASGESQWITGPAARADVQALRARSCAILTGVGTVLADDPALTVRDARFAVDGRLRQPLIVVADTHGRTPPTAKILASSGGVLLAHGSNATGETPEGVATWRSDGERIDLEQLLRHLAAREVNEVLVEAGATLVGAFLETPLWDEIVLYQAPRFLGADARPLAAINFASLSATIGARIAGHEQVGDDLKITLRPNR